MRPVLLEMAGFGSFREPTVVDFTDADYFALVGPTGAGKSTVIDALTFALFGSVPRWDDRRTVALALAPTANRGTVRLVFDVGTERYVVARELRRAATSGSVTVKNVRLERLVDPVGTADDETEPVAADSKVTPAVEELLGLNFEHFTTCVVLPQGDFAEFLHARAGDRQKILVKLLGLEVYDQIAKAANAEAAKERHNVEFLVDQLSRYTDATEQDEAEATARVTALVEVEQRLGTELPELATASAAAAGARATVARLIEERDRLSDVRVPDELGELDERHRTTKAAAAKAAAAVAAREAEDTAARDALAAAPARGPLEQAKRDRAELERLAAHRPELAERQAAAGRALTEAEEAVQAADTAAEQARAALAAAAATAQAARAQVERLVSERERLTAVVVPAGLEELDGRLRVARDAAAKAAAGLETCEAADSAARSALAAAPVRAPLEGARRDVVELERLATQRPELVERQQAAAEAVAAAERAGKVAERALAQAREALEAAGREATAAALRPHLVAGEPCPVCAQPVLTLPAPFDEAGTEAPATAVTEAERAIEARRTEWSGAARLAQQAESALAAADQRAVAVRAELGEYAGKALADLERMLDALDALETAARAADTALVTARKARADADRDLAKLEAEAAGFATGLRAARDGLVPLGAPAGAGDDVAAGWAALAGWAAKATATRTTELAGAEAEAERSAADATAAEQMLATANARLAAARAGHTEAARAEQRAAGELATADQQVATLTTRLADAPDAERLAAELARLDELEAATREADRTLRAARGAASTAAQAGAEAGEAIARMVRELTGVRDPLVALGAPAIPADDPVGGWQAFAEWAAAEAAARSERLPQAEKGVGTAEAALASREAELSALLAALEVDVPGGRPLGEAAAPALAGALGQARAAEQRVLERRREAAELRERASAAESAQQVARQLGQLLRSDAFPRWLVASALDVLVAEASATLSELSGGQFALTHEAGEFVVVDHADADSRRPVKTLSGGETFQASLALALALSAQLSTMAASGAARLDAIFLDEGFGTLDEATLEVVAATLENLAAGGDRMVGLVTHVAALAERVPVRFEVSRDQRTSSVTKVQV
jgi:exonuclease SbcC